jgi:hypothetical protein
LLFHEALYYTVVTLSTLGYGDYSPWEKSALSQILMTMLILGFMFFVPYQSARFFELRRLVSAYRGAFNSPAEHIVICCDPFCPSVRSFLLEFFHPDHGVVSNVHVVLLVPSEPTPIMREVRACPACTTHRRVCSTRAAKTWLTRFCSPRPCWLATAPSRLCGRDVPQRRRAHRTGHGAGAPRVCARLLHPR